MRELAPLDDSRAICVASGQVCVGKVAILTIMAEDERLQGKGPEVEFPVVDDEDSFSGEEMYPRSPFMGRSVDNDRIANDLRLREYDFHAKRLGCIGPQNEDCPTRVYMENSSARTNLLAVVRTIFKGV